ncbi:MAG: amidohydrolase family protein [Deltaproteobacteria bacterium]|nr:MAG: amidohydrolase family protein [Deltaproteobacteria bacterium]
MLIRRAEIDGAAPLDVRVRDRAIAEIGSGLASPPGEPVLDAAGGALIPGLHDHHIHLFALAATGASVRCGPPQVRDADALAQALAGAPEHGGWIRGVGYHESVAGDLDRARLDRLVPDRPLRIQHRSGALWVVNSIAAERLGLDRGADERGIERDADGRATGRLYRLDAWLRERVGEIQPPSLARASRRLAACGVTGLTDATPENSDTELRAFLRASDRGELLQRLVVMGAPGLAAPPHRWIRRGPVKVRLDERDLPRFDALRQRIEDAHREGRAVAVHCVTRAELVLATAAFAEAGALRGDRIEHAAVAPPDAVEIVAGLPLTVVTQPGFVRERGDAYLTDVEPRDRPWLYRCRGWLRASVPLGGSTDAPFGDADPWRAIRAAVDRRTENGAALGADETLTPERALALFTSPPEAPGGPPRAIAVGAAADLCVLDRPWSKARAELSSACVAATVRGGALIWQRD